DEDISDFFAKLRLYLQNQGVNPADNVGGLPTGREIAIGYLRGYMKERALEYTVVQIGNQALNKALGQPGNTIVKLRAVEGSWNEDWRITGSHSTNIAVNAPNANNTSREIYEPLPISAPQQQGISLEDMQKAIQNQAVAQKAQAPASQTVEPVRQPRGQPLSLQTKKGIENYNLTQYLYNLDIFSTEDFDRNFSIKPFQKPCPEQFYLSNQNAKIDRIELKIDEIGQMISQFGRMMLENQSKKSPEKYNKLLPKLLPAMRKICQSHIVQEKELKSDEWFSSLQYLHCNINDLLITNSFLDSTSEFSEVNDATINTLGWRADKPSDFAIKGNFKHISESLEWYTDVPISVKDKDNKIIQKVHGVLDPSKNQFQMKLHRKTYTIPTFSKPPRQLIKTEEWLDMALNIIDSDKQINFFHRLEFYSKIQIISDMKNLENKAIIKKKFIRALDYAEYLKKN
ncbi:12122_t:CDS:2, partial [Cetraspora pellucida]